MPCRQRPAFEVAVSASPLFKLALEVRIMIYELLLIQEGGMFIPSDTFARRNYGRSGSTPHECLACGFVSLSDEGCMQHIAKHRYYTIVHHLQFCRPLQPLLPGVSVSLFQICRIIRFEASPILYLKNGFHFPDPVTASNFRWGTDCVQAGAIQEIGVKIGSSYFSQVTPWMAYFTKRTLSLGQDFPYLRRVTFHLGGSPEVERAAVLRSMSESFRERSQGLDWVLIVMMNHEKVLECFEPLVHREDDSKNRKKEVRRHVWATGGPWKDALLWWGFPGEAVPRKYRLVGDQPQQQVSSEGTDEGGSTLTGPA